MSTVDTADTPKKRRGRPRKQEQVVEAKVEDQPSVQGAYQAREAEKARTKAKVGNKVVEKYWVQKSGKLLLYKRMSDGKVYKFFEGLLKNKKIKEQAQKLQKEGRLRTEL